MDRLGSRNSSGDVCSESLCAVSAPSSGRQPRSSSPLSKSPGGRLACAFNALKCSSRALQEDNNPPTMPRGSHPGDGDKTSMENHKIQCYAPPLPPRTGNRQKEVPELSSTYSKSTEDHESDTSSHLLKLAGVEKLDHSPFEDMDDQEEKTSSTSNQTPSDDTPGTPNVSNRDPRKAPQRKPLVVQTIPDPEYDEFCQSNFNTPRMLHCNGSLGDDISPLISPDNESDDADEGSDNCDANFRSSLNSHAKRELQLPIMAPTIQPGSRSSLLSESSSISKLFGESISDEKTVADEIDHILTSLGSTQTQENLSSLSPPRLPTLQQTKVNITPSETYHTLQPEDSSYSTVSSFVVATKERPPFFWRSHPKVTVYSHQMKEHEASTRDFSMRTRQSTKGFSHHQHSFPLLKKTSGSHVDVVSVKELLDSGTKPFGLQVNMSSLTAYATDRLDYFRRRTSSSQ